MSIIKQFCAENSHFFTDELTSYACLDRAGMRHSVIEHGKKEFSKDGVTTNSIEGFWGHFIDLFIFLTVFLSLTNFQL